MKLDRNSGAMYTLADIAREVNGAAHGAFPDGTYVAQLSAERDGDYWAPAIRLTRAAESHGYEVAYDAITPERPFTTEGGARAYLREGDRVGIWTGPDGVVCIDRTVYLQGGDASIAWVLGESFSQLAIWDWARGIAIGPDGEPLA